MDAILENTTRDGRRYVEILTPAFKITFEGKKATVEFDGGDCRQIDAEEAEQFIQTERLRIQMEHLMRAHARAA